MKLRHRALVAAGLAVPSACAPTAHRGHAPDQTAVSTPPEAAATGPGAAEGDGPSAPGPVTTSAEPVVSTSGSAGATTTVTIAAPPAAPATTRRATTTTVTVAPFVMPEAETEETDDEWADRQRMAGPRALVSWYGAESGSHTANGDVYDPNGLTFANKTMAFGTRVRFCGPLGCVVATCTDRGPFVAGRTFDLSRGAFARVAPLSAGVAELAWEVVG